MNENQSNTKLTIIATVVTTIAIVPGFILGISAWLVFGYFQNVSFSNVSSGSWFPFLDGFFITFWKNIFPEIFRHAVASYFAIWIGSRFKKINFDIVALISSVIWLTIGVFILAMTLVFVGFYKNTFPLILAIIGICFGSWLAFTAYKSEQKGDVNVE